MKNTQDTIHEVNYEFSIFFNFHGQFSSMNIILVFYHLAQVVHRAIE
jgi:hypothetical protein